jgi:L-2-hydroxyglutarate oxidase
MLPERAEILIVGGGVIGLTIARELVARGRSDILILEKEEQLGEHASGRNSGVLHAGIYYAPDSLRAKSCLGGNRMMKAFCREKGLPLLEAGKVIVARTEAELPTLEELHRRASANGARVRFVDEKELAELEPMARTVGKALHSLDTAVTDPKKVLAALRAELEGSGKVRILTGCRFLGRQGFDAARTSMGNVRYARFVNASGAWCDVVAGAFGLGSDYRLIPFKGIYRKVHAGGSFPVNGNIYPVPDIRNPFLGVHFTRSASGDVYVGPTAIPAFGRENYRGLQNTGADGIRILFEDAVLFFANPKFRSVALSEPKKYLPSVFHRDAARLVKSYDPSLFDPADKIGIRPQLVDWRTKELVMDFIVLAVDGSVHVMNPISPAFTSSMFLAKQLVEEHFA